MNIIIHNAQNVNISSYENAKHGAEKLQEYISKYYINNEKQAQAHNVQECGTFLQFKCYENNQSLLHKANFCKNPLCPMCEWRKHLKLSKAVESALNQSKGYIYHIVLGIPNVQALNKKTIANLQSSANKFLNDESAIYAKAFTHNLEITYSAEHGFHPHLHCLVETDYFIKISKAFVKDLSLYWRSIVEPTFEYNFNMVSYFGGGCNTCESGYTCYIRGIPKTQLHSASEELTKYVFKTKQEELNYDSVSQLMSALYNKRKFTSKGTIKKNIAKAIKNISNAELEKELNLNNLEWWYQVYNWIGGHYELQ